MRVFISWSGPRSEAFAKELKVWIRSVCHGIESPFMSAEDIHVGSNWHRSLDDELRDKRSVKGIICLTPENRSKPWILFEAGCLNNAIGDSSVIPILCCGLKRSDIDGPLAQFQSVTDDKQGIEKLMRHLNEALPEQTRLDAALLRAQFEKWWPDFKAVVERVRSMSHQTASERTSQDLLEEIVERVRAISENVTPDLEVFGASYGTLDVQMDVTEKIREAVRARREIVVAPSLTGGFSPGGLGDERFLTITIMRNGEPSVSVFPDGRSLSLPDVLLNVY